MNIIEGDFQGRSGRIINAAFRGSVFEIYTGMVGKKTYKVPADIETLKLLNKDEKRTARRTILLIILSLIVVGLIITIPLFIIWKKVDFAIGIKTKDGKKFITQGDASDWKVVKNTLVLGY